MRLSSFRLAVVAASIPFALQAASAQQPAPAARQPIEAFAKLQGLSGPRLSPNGRMLAGKVAIRGETFLMTIPVDGGAPNLVQTGDYDLRWWRWVNDDWLVVGVGGEAPFGINGTAYVSRALGVSADGKTIHPLLEKLRKMAQNGDDMIWSATDGSPRVMLSVQSSIYSDQPGFYPEVYEVDVAANRFKLVQGSREGVFDWVADSAGNVRMGIGRDGRGDLDRILYRGAGGGGLREIRAIDKDGKPIAIPSNFLDGERAVTIADDADGFSTLYEFDTATFGKGKPIYASKGYDLAGFEFDDWTKRLLGVHVEEKGSSTVWIDPAMSKLQAEINGKIKGGSAAILSWSRDLNRTVVRIGAADSPGAYYLYDRPTGGMKRLAFVNPAIGMSKLHPVSTIEYKARDGLSIQAVLTLPKNRKANLPLIVMPHGGPFARDSEGWDWWAQFLADRGYAVVQPNYRGSSGFGTTFAEKGEGEWGLKMQDDLVDAVAHLAKQGIADPKRVCITGGSYGGYAAMWAAQRDSATYRCAVSYAGVSDLKKLTRGMYGELYAGKRSNWLKKQAPDFAAISPLTHPEKSTVPLLLVHGKRDTRVSVDNSRALAARLKWAGKDVTYIEQPKADHFFSREEDRLEFLRAMEAFLAKHNPA